MERQEYPETVLKTMETIDPKIPVTSRRLKLLLGDSVDMIARDVVVDEAKHLGGTLFFVDALANQMAISHFLMYPLGQGERFRTCQTGQDVYRVLLSGGAIYSDVKGLTSLKDAADCVLLGDAVFCLWGTELAIRLDVKGYAARAIGTAAEESTFRASKDTFVERLRTNTALLRGRIRSHNLCIEQQALGRRSNTQVALCYHKTLVMEGLIAKIKERLEAVDVDRILYLDDLVTYLKDSKVSPFPQFTYTERPEIAAVSVLEGKAAIFVDGLPYAILIPTVMGDLFQASSDYNLNYVPASLFRLLRYGLFFLTFFLAAFYISVAQFHPEMLPTSLAFAIAASKEGTPFPVFVEIGIMTAAFFTLIEAGLRIPNAIGSTISIVGGLILGEAAINAKLVSPAVIVVVAVAAVASFSIPNTDLNMAVWVFQVAAIGAASIMGLIGVSMVFIVILHHLATMDVYDVPYLSPFVGEDDVSLRDGFLRYNERALNIRPPHLKPKNRRRRGIVRE